MMGVQLIEQAEHNVQKFVGLVRLRLPQIHADTVSAKTIFGNGTRRNQCAPTVWQRR